MTSAQPQQSDVERVASGSPQDQTPAKPPRRAHPKQTRMAINLNPDAADFLSKVTREQGITYTEAVRRALAIYKLVMDEIAEGHHVQLYDGQKTREIVLL
jgi:hypothetical protein